MKIVQRIFWTGILMLLLCKCGNTGSETPEKGTSKYSPNETFKNRLTFEHPVRQQVVEGIPLTGTVETNPDKVVHFVSLVGGIITNTSFSLGDIVRKGQVLAELRSPELSSLYAELQNLESRIKVAQKQLESVQAMYKDHVSSKKNLLEAKSDLDILKAERQKVNSNMNFYNASTGKGVFQLKAPVSGIITSKSIASGTQISAGGEPLYTIADLNEVWIMVNIYASDIRNIHKDMKVNIKTLVYPDMVLHGEISAVAQLFDEETRVLKARIVLPNKDLKLKPGMLVDVTALKQRNVDALSINTNSIVFDNNTNYVVVGKADGTFENRPVKILSQNNGISFLSQGLREGEKIVSTNQLLVYEQLKNFQD